MVYLDSPHQTVQLNVSPLNENDVKISVNTNNKWEHDTLHLSLQYHL